VIAFDESLQHQKKQATEKEEKRTHPAVLGKPQYSDKQIGKKKLKIETTPKRTRKRE